MDGPKYKYIVFGDGKLIDSLKSRLKNRQNKDCYMSIAGGFIMFNDLSAVLLKDQRKHQSFTVYKIETEQKEDKDETKK